MLTCGGAALTTIDKKVRWPLGIKMGGESFIGGHLKISLKAMVTSFLSSQDFYVDVLFVSFKL